MPKIMPQTHALDDSDEIDLGQLLSTIWSGRWLIAFCMIVAVVLGGIYAFALAAPKYKATASIIFEAQEQKGAGLGALVAGADGGTGLLSGVLGGGSGIENEAEIIRSRPLLEQLVKEQNLLADPEFNGTLREPGFVAKLKGAIFKAILGPGKPPSELNILHQTTDAVSETLSVEIIRDTSILEVSFKTESADKSAAMANTLVDIYINNQIEKGFQRNEGYISRLAERVTELDQDLQSSEAALTNFNSKTNLISTDSFQLMTIKLKELRDRLNTAQLKKSEADILISELTAALDANNLVAAAELANNQTLNNLLIQSEEGDNAARTRFLTLTKSIIGKSKQDLIRQAAQIDTLTSSIKQIETTLDEQSEDLRKMTQLEREAAANKVIYEYFVGRLKGVTTEQGVSANQSSILSPAIVPTLPVEPRKKVILMLALVLGGLIGAAWVLLREMRKTGFTSALDLERVTGLPVLGLFPQIPMRKRADVLKYMVEKPNSKASEAIRDLRTSLLLSNIDQPPQVIIITSSMPDEGKTTQSLGLALKMSGLGQRVLLIEGDIRNRRFRDYFDIQTTEGILSVLSEESDLDNAITRNDYLGCDILLGGHSTANAADVFSSRKFHDMIAELRKRYDAIIIDTPPVLMVPDARVIAQNADAVIYVVKWDSTSETQLRNGLRLFDAVNTPVTGTVLSQVNIKQQVRDGYTGYGYYQN